MNQDHYDSDLPPGSWRSELNVPNPPHEWRRIAPIGQSRVVWRNPNSEGDPKFRGYGRKEIQHLADGVIIEKDTYYYGGGEIAHPDPDAGMVRHTLDLIYRIRNSVLVDKHGFDTLVGRMPYDEAIRLRDGIMDGGCISHFTQED